MVAASKCGHASYFNEGETQVRCLLSEVSEDVAAPWSLQGVGRGGVGRSGGPALPGNKFQILEHGVLECQPSELGVRNAADGTLDDAGLGGTKAVEGALQADGPEVIEVFSIHALAGIGCSDSGDPDGTKGVDEGARYRDASTLAKYGVIEEQGFRTNLIGDGLFVGNEFHPDGAHAGFRHVPEGFKHTAGVGAVPLEKSEVNAGGVFECDMQHLAGGAAQHGSGFCIDFGERGDGGRGRVVGGRLVVGG